MKEKLIKYTEDGVTYYKRVDKFFATEIGIDEERIYVFLYEVEEGIKISDEFIEAVELFPPEHLAELPEHKRQFVSDMALDLITGAIEYGMTNDEKYVIDLTETILQSVEMISRFYQEHLRKKSE